jgi:hypothetical protein
MVLKNGRLDLRVRGLFLDMDVHFLCSSNVCYEKLGIMPAVIGVVFRVEYQNKIALA